MGLLDKVNAKLAHKIQEKDLLSQSSNSNSSEKPSQGNSAQSHQTTYIRPAQPISLPQRNVASASLYAWDTIDLSGFDRRTIDLIHEFIPGAWPGGIQSSMVTQTSHMIQLVGSPWSHGFYPDHNVVSSRRLVYSLLQILYDNGWVLNGATSITGLRTSRDLWLFRKQPIQPRQWMAVHFVAADAFLLIDTPQDICQAFFSKFQPLIQDQGDRAGAFYIKLRGYPFAENGSGNEEARFVLMDMTEILDQFGFFIYTSIDLTSADRGRDSWVCCRL